MFLFCFQIIMASCERSLKMHVNQNCPNILGKVWEVVKLEQMLLIEPMRDYFPDILSEFSANFRKM